MIVRVPVLPGSRVAYEAHACEVLLNSGELRLFTRVNNEFGANHGSLDHCHASQADLSALKGALAEADKVQTVVVEFDRETVTLILDRGDGPVTESAPETERGSVLEHLRDIAVAAFTERLKRSRLFR